MENIVDLGGSSNLNLLIEAGNHRYVVRVYRPYVTKGRLNDIQLVRRQLIASGMPCSGTLLTQSEKPWLEFNDRLIEAEPYVDHDGYMVSWERLEIALPMLGRLHTISRSIATSQAGRHPVFANHIDFEVLLDRTCCGTRPVRGWTSAPFARQLAEMAEELAHLVRAAGNDLISMLPRQLVHGDYWYDNVLFHKGDIALITDFDFMGERPRITDLALTLYFTSLKHAEKPVSENQLMKMGRLVDAYDCGLVDPLSSIERAALPLMIASQPLWSIGGWVALLDDEATAQQHAMETL